MIKIEVRALNEQPLASPLAADFDEMGGTIGRAAGNTLVLPDENRHISRTQASISFRAGGYVLSDLGSATPTIVNGMTLGSGREAPVRPGDEIRIGDYVLQVSAAALRPAHASAAEASPADPFADLLGTSLSSAPPIPAPSRAPSQSPHVVQDPFAAPAVPHASGYSAQANVIPLDFDPFAETSPPPLPGEPNASAPDPLATGIPASVDDLFGLKLPAGWDPLAPDDPLRPRSVSPASTDPLSGFGPSSLGTPAAATPAQRDDAPLLSNAFRLPSAVPGAARRSAGEQRAATAPADVPQAQPRAPIDSGASSGPSPAQAPAYHAAPPPTGMVVSWDTEAQAHPGEIKTAILSSPKRASAAGPGAVVEAPGSAAPWAHAPHQREHAPQTPALGEQPGNHDELLRAFLAGAGANDLRVPGGLTPEFMQLIGEVLREALRGTLDLLLARALTKREVRAQATVIVARENNPLKFSPSVEAALANLLSAESQSRGFMAPVNAMRDAYNDLRSHQFGFMAGMRAALAGVLARFDPAQLEQRLTGKSVVGSLIPSSRRAKLWELYEQLYRDISREAEDDFQTLFGKEFLRAYEAQIEKLEQEDAADRR